MSFDPKPEAGPSRAAAAARQPGGREPGKPARLARSKAACLECHKAKQRCDGPPGPCHRCNTWNIECTFPSAAGPAPSKTTLSRSSTPQPTAKSARTPVTPAASTSDGLAATPDVAEQLRLMNARLESLESTLSRSQLAFPAAPPPPPPAAAPPPPALHRSQAGSESSPMPLAGVTPLPEVHRDGANAVETAGEAMAVEGLVDLSGPGRGAAAAAATSWDAVKPDVLGRSIMTLEECDAEFDFYFEHIQPWTCLLSTTIDRHPLVVRERSPLLFHSILLITVYYRPRTPANIVLYRAISSLLDAILAPQILCPQPDTLSFDFVRAVHLLLLYKPVQYAALNARGISDPAQIESSSKMNVRASWLLRLLVSRVAAFIGLPSIATTFAQAFANQHVAPISDEIVAQQRLYLACVFHESHGALQSGKSANFIPQDACKTTRLFATLKKQPSDVRLAASVELVATLSTLLNARKEDGSLEADDLRTYDDELDAWKEYWQPLLTAPDVQDPLAWSPFYPYASFSRLTVRGFAFNRWKEERKACTARNMDGQGGRTALTEEERENIAKAARTAEEMMLAVSTEGKALRARTTIPELLWEAEGSPLRPDPEIVNSLKWASDSLTCVMFSYPLIFLAKLANEGLLHSDLTIIPAGSSPLPPSPMLPTDKLCRLFLLGADLLDAIAPNPHHPSVKQANFLRKVWDAAVSGRRSITSAPSSPRLNPTHYPPTMPPPQLPPAALLPQAQTAAPPRTAPPQHPLPAPQTSVAAIAASGSAAAALATYSDFSLSASYQPTPTQSPRVTAVSASPGQPHSAEDPFAALLSGVSPSIFDDGQSLFSLDGGIDWSAINGEGAGGFGGGGGAPQGNGGFGGMQY
ncbi:hypothetical protein JCM21900_005531 [Sporobolomyces salmonicolor]